jgi:UDPglucose 6-dehydrogenase
MSRIAVVGLGYVGVTTAVGLAKLGHEVLGYDLDNLKVKTLLSGKSPIHEAGLEDTLGKLLSSENLSFTLAFEDIEALGPEFVFVCVGTPQDDSGAADLSTLDTVATQLTEVLPVGAIMIIKSTVPVGTCQRIAQALNRSDILVASNPEFLREGTAISDFMQPDRVVVGANSPEVAKKVMSLYDAIEAPKLETSLESSELIKYAANAYLAMRLSFTNDIANLAEATKANVDQVLFGMGLDKRIGNSFLKPGPGWGGSCFPKDTSALVSIAKSYDSRQPLVESAINSNQAALTRSADVIEGLVGGDLANKTVAVWGVAFKANTDDVRDSPSLKIVDILLKRGATVKAFDPFATAPEQTGLSMASSALEATVGADALAILTEWPEFSKISPELVAGGMKESVVYDARRILPESWRSHFSVFKVLGEAAK